MAKKKPFMPATDAGKQQTFSNLSVKLPLYKEKYNITQEEIDDMISSKLSMDYVILCRDLFEEWMKAVTKHRDELWYDVTSGKKPMPPIPALPPEPSPVDGGIVERANAIAAIIKKRMNYVESEGKDMGIVGPLIVVDPTTQKPILKGKLLANGMPQFTYIKGQMDGASFQVDRGDGIWAGVNTSLTGKFVDKAALPAAGTAKVLKFKAIYIVDSEQVGLWSDIASITVTGV